MPMNLRDLRGVLEKTLKGQAVVLSEDLRPLAIAILENIRRFDLDVQYGSEIEPYRAVFECCLGGSLAPDCDLQAGRLRLLPEEPTCVRLLH